MAYENGQWPASALAAVPGQPGLKLEPAAAASWGRLRADVGRRKGWTPLLTDAYRAMDGYYGQLATFLRRYTLTYSVEVNGPTKRTKVWQGRAYYLRKGMATAATPGTSNHGIGLAVDVTGLGAFGSDRYDDFADVALENGWDNREGAAIGEPWHWRYRPENDRHRGTTTTVSNPVTGAGGTIPTPGGDLPDPLEEDVKLDAEDLTAIADLIRRETGAAVWGHEVLGGQTAGGNLGSIRPEIASIPGAVLAAQVGAGGTLSEWIESTRADFQRADEITRAQLTALTTALDALAASRGVDPAQIRQDVQVALAGLTATLTLTTQNGA